MALGNSCTAPKAGNAAAPFLLQLGRVEGLKRSCSFTDLVDRDPELSSTPTYASASLRGVEFRHFFREHLLWIEFTSI